MRWIRAVMQGNLGMEVIITKNGNENDKFKECREVKIIENGHICKKVISQIWSGAFLVNFEYIYCTMLFCFYFEQVNTGWEE